MNGCVNADNSRDISGPEFPESVRGASAISEEPAPNYFIYVNGLCFSLCVHSLPIIA